MPGTSLSDVTGPGLPTPGLGATQTKLLSADERAKLGLTPTAAPAAKQTLNGTPNGLGKDDFLKLLLAQLSNQDPLKPMDDTQFISQLAQFNSLEQAQQTNQHLADMMMSQSLGQASSLIGRQITGKGAKGDTVTGVVDHVQVINGKPLLFVGSDLVALADVTKVEDAVDTTSTDGSSTNGMTGPGTAGTGTSSSGTTGGSTTGTSNGTSNSTTTSSSGSTSPKASGTTDTTGTGTTATGATGTGTTGTGTTTTGTTTSAGSADTVTR